MQAVTATDIESCGRFPIPKQCVSDSASQQQDMLKLLEAFPEHPALELAHHPSVISRVQERMIPDPLLASLRLGRKTLRKN